MTLKTLLVNKFIYTANEQNKSRDKSFRMHPRRTLRAGKGKRQRKEQKKELYGSTLAI